MNRVSTRVGLALCTTGMMMALAACQIVIGIEDTIGPDASSPDGAPPTHVPYIDASPGDPSTGENIVRGAAIGVLVPLSLELVYDGRSEVIDITSDGPFAFEAILQQGDSYSIRLMGEPPCLIENGEGVISGADTEIMLACEGAPFLTGLTLSGTSALSDIDVSLMRSEYMADMPLLEQSVSIIPIALRPETTISIAGSSVASGTSSAPLPLALGDNDIEITVAHPSGLERTYHLIIRRAPALLQHTYAKASNTGADDRFGVSVAIDGDTLAVGAYHEDSGATGVGGGQEDDSTSDSGAVYVFRRVGTGWVQEAYIKASNPGTNDLFGFSIALSGNTLAVGARYEDSAAKGVGGSQGDSSTGANSGAVYIYRRSSGSTWVQEAYIKASNTGAGDNFGFHVALAGDNLAVGAPGESSATTGVNGSQIDDNATASGAVYIFQRTGTSWAQKAYIKASNTNVGDTFGHRVSLSGDRLAVVALGEDSLAKGIGGSQTDNGAPDSGAVYVFRRTSTSWIQEAYIKASNTGTNDEFGFDMNLDGEALVVGARSEDSGATGVNGSQTDNSAGDAGAVYVFRRTSTSWAQEAYIKASNTDAGDNFGWSVALAGDLLAVGAPYEDSAATGVNGSEISNSLGDSGAVYLFQRTGTSWAKISYAKASNTGLTDGFGINLALDIANLVVGARHEDSGGTGVNGNQGDNTAGDSGAVYILH